jgi:large subunit ribosomal protein L6
MAKETKLHVTIPDGITVSYEKATLKLSKGDQTVEKILESPAVIIKTEGNSVTLEAVNVKRKTIAVLNAQRSHIQNMIIGLETGYEYKLAVVHSHFPMGVKVNGDKVEISNYLGEKFPRLAQIVGETKVEIKGKTVIVTGVDKEQVSQTAANIESSAKVKNKDQRIFQDGIYITKKGVQEA